MAATQDVSSMQPMEACGSSISASSTPGPPQPVANTAPEPTIPYSWRERHPNAQIIYIRDHQQANVALQQLKSGFYGFDLEWKPNFVKGQAENRVALVQIANHEFILLLQVSRMQQFPSKLYEFLLDPNVIKVGVGIQGDAKKLYQDWDTDLKNCVDLALLARTVDNDKWKGKYTNPLGLARLIGVYENRVLAKGKITRSNWERLLNEAQQIYAANDAHAGYVLYTKLMAMLPSVSPQPEIECYTFDTVDGRLCIPFSTMTWNAFNPNYDPGPPPPPREPKLPKPPRPAGLPNTMVSDQLQPIVGRGPGSGALLPAPQSTMTSRGYNHRRGRGFRANLPSRPPRYPQAHSFQAPSQSNTWLPHLPNNMTRQPHGPSSLPPRTTQLTLYYHSGAPMNPSSSTAAETFQDPSRHEDDHV